MAITPADIESLTFSEAKRGYNTDEVDAFLDQVSGEIDAMLSKIADLKGRLNNSEQQLAASQAQVAQLRDQAAASASAVTTTPAPAPTPAMTATEQQISQVLIVAQQSADRLVDEARAAAEDIRNEADQKAREVIRQALAEKQAEFDEIERLKQSREDFRGEYKRLLQHFMDDADAVFPQMSLNVSRSTPVRAEVQQPSAISAHPNAEASVRASENAPALGGADGFDDLD